MATGHKISTAPQPMHQTTIRLVLRQQYNCIVSRPIIKRSLETIFANLLGSWPPLDFVSRDSMRLRIIEMKSYRNCVSFGPLWSLSLHTRSLSIDTLACLALPCLALARASTQRM